MREKLLSKRQLRAALLSVTMLVTAVAAPFLAPDNGGKVSAASIDANFAKALQYSLYFYDANMCGGEVGEKSLLDWRDDCHTQDKNAKAPNGQTVDVSGGFHDAGDHVKFGLPGAYSASMLEWGYYEFPDAYKSAGQFGHWKTITDYFADYFKRCTVMDSSGNVQYFCYQVGDGDIDHGIWSAPEAQGTMNRPTWWASSSNPATDIVSNTAGALALHSKNTGDAESLKYAKALYEFAKKNNKSCATDGCAAFYGSDSYLDDISWAAGCLFAATGDSSYKSDATGFLSSSNYANTSTWPLCWGSMWPAANAMVGDYATVQKQIGDATGSNNWYFKDGWGSARYNTAVQLCALVVAKHTNNSSLATWAQGQMKYLMGENNQNKCYIIGYNQYTVKYPHHRASSGLDDANNTGEHKHLLLGALVGGPEDASGNHRDITSNYQGNEVAVDYNAAFVGACAGLYSNFGSGQKPDSAYYIDGSTSEPDPVETTTEEPEIPDDPTDIVDIDIIDIKTLAQIILGKKTANSAQYETYDYSDDGKLSAVDLAVAKRIVTRDDIIVPPVETDEPVIVTEPPSEDGVKTVEVNENIIHGADATNSVKVLLDDLLPASAKPTSFTFKLKASSAITIYQGAFGISVDDSCPAKTDSYWYMGEQFEKNGSGNTMTVTFEVPSEIKDYIHPGYGANVYLGCWYSNVSSVTVESVTCNYS